ncbi:transposase [Clostridium botulinum]|uniref:transposase n=2 Tax=Clostridium botulinum TaxID=1491 RepID=UPI0031BAE7DB
MFFKSDKLHCAACVCNNVLPLSFSITTANVYDNQVQGLLYELKTYNPFIVLADDDQWFKVSKTLEYNLLTDVNMRKAKSIESFKDESRYKNALFMQSPIGKNLYKNRLKIEQLFSILKGLYNLENPRLYGQKRYERHVKWVLLSYLIDEFNKVNSKISSRKYPWNL